MLEYINKGALLSRYFIIFVLISFSGCSNTEIGNPEALSLFSMKNDSDLSVYLQEQYLSDSSPAQPDNSDEPDTEPHTSEKDEAGFKDDMILISSNGFIYQAEGNRVIVSRAENGKSDTIIASIETFGNIVKLFENQNILIVVMIIKESLNPEKFNSSTQTGVLFIDISNPWIPEKLKEIQVDGQLIDSVLRNEYIYIIQQFKTEIDLIQYQENFSIDKLIPCYAYIDDLGQALGFLRLVQPKDLFRPAVPSGALMTIVTALNVKDLFEMPQSVGFIGDIQSVSLNPASIYLNESSGSVYEINIAGTKPVFTDFDNTI
ncbi:Beta propeller domain-containing protein [Desulfonema limicola]|uniref:Beta propeller domain-containing protein n=1 Tax=Desulfonema limicola TaxID=45656 RepID=A0A975B8T5_9BACT|nr:beta-propeller domain-containing protein [Desulfonema limicola]QTA80988.1 Beta propeller domain-containing protein [Desulfonema limicola]